jgi:hypothetical protein
MSGLTSAASFASSALKLLIYAISSFLAFSVSAFSLVSASVSATSLSRTVYFFISGTCLASLLGV